jgi:CHAT domain-containing protein/Tfp pilus assembly protein PilF
MRSITNPPLWCAVIAALLLAPTASIAVQPPEKSFSQSRDVDELERLKVEVVNLYRAGNFEEALPKAERALAIAEKTLGPDDPSIAGRLNDLGAVYQAIGAYAEAELRFTRAISITEKVRGPKHPATATLLDNLAAMYFFTGAYAKAEPLFQRALDIREHALAPDDQDIATSLDHIATLYQATGDYPRAEPLYKRALKIREEALGPDDPGTAASLSNLADLYRVTGAYSLAEPLIKRALTINEETLRPDDPRVARSLNILALLYRGMGSDAKAVPQYQHALAIAERALGPDHPATATIRNNLGLLYRSIGAFGEAEPLLRRALAIDEKAFGPDHPSVATSANSLASLYQSMGEYDKAEALYKRGLAIIEKALGPEHPHTAAALNNLGSLYYAKGVCAEGEALGERAQAINELNTARALLAGSEARKLAFLWQDRGNTYANVSHSLACSTARSKALGLTSVLQYKGRALDAFSDGVARLRRSVAPQDLGLFDQLSGVAQEISTLTFRGPEKLSAEAYAERLAEFARKSDALQEELSKRSATFRQAATPITLRGVQRALPAGAVLVEWLRYLPFNPRATGPESAYWGAPRYAAYVLRSDGEPAALDLGAAAPIDALVADLRAALSDPRTTYVSEVAQELYEKLFEPLRPHVKEGEHLLLSPDGQLNLLPFAALVDGRGQFLVQHFEISYLTSGRDLLRASPDSIPGEGAMVLADPDYGPSDVAPPPSGVTSGDARSADMDRGGLLFKRLEGTAEEAKALKTLLQLDAAHVLTGDQATEARLKGLHGPRILHLATHGFFLGDRDSVFRPAGFTAGTQDAAGENPLLRSGLALAGANARRSGTTDDGILTASEAAQLNLVGTQLVVLSACETAVGAVQTGEGVYGLRRALVLAGAQAQIASLWKVADSATQALIVDFYRRLLKGEGRSPALRAAQEALLADPRYRHPYFWAAFIQIGDWTPLAALK